MCRPASAPAGPRLSLPAGYASLWYTQKRNGSEVSQGNPSGFTLSTSSFIPTSCIFLTTACVDYADGRHLMNVGPTGRPTVGTPAAPALMMGHRPVRPTFLMNVGPTGRPTVGTPAAPALRMGHRPVRPPSLFVLQRAGDRGDSAPLSDGALDAGSWWHSGQSELQ